MRSTPRSFGMFFFLLLGAFAGPASSAAGDEPSESYAKCLRASRDMVVRMETELGDFDVRLFGSRAPITVCNFMRYVEAGSFDEGRFSRTVRPDNQTDKPVKIDVIQGHIREGAKEFAPIPMERTITTGIHHVNGAISMARDLPESATSSFFLSVGDQLELDYGGKRNPDGQGFAAFGRVIHGMEVVKRIWASPASRETLTPPVTIKRVYRLER
jgi:peptidyl-prolyl cis-trans isomerase A (cyclophilin A)